MAEVSPIRLRVAELRAAKGWTQAELAERASIGRITVIRVESDTNKRIDYDVLEKLADALGVDAGYLIVHERDAKRRGKG